MTLHTWYTADEAVASFRAEAAPVSYCDGQFVVLPTVVVCLVTIGETADESHVPCPSSVVWRPRRLDYEPSDKVPWLPETVREVYDRGQNPIKKIRDHHVFLRSATDERFFYAGAAHLGSYVSALGRDGSGVYAEFSLHDRLPREEWLNFGGYPGWLVDVNHRNHRITLGDMPAFERLVNDLGGEKFSHLCMTRYEEDSLTIQTNARRGRLMFLRHPGDAGVYTRDLEYDGPDDAEEEFKCACGIDLEFPASETLPREQAMHAAIEFFQTGQLPRCVHWELE